MNEGVEGVVCVEGERDIKDDVIAPGARRQRVGWMVGWGSGDLKGWQKGLVRKRLFARLRVRYEF